MPMSFKDYLAEANAVVEAIDVGTAKGLVGDPNVQFVDVRDGDEVARSGLIAGAVHEIGRAHV